MTRTRILGPALIGAAVLISSCRQDLVAHSHNPVQIDSTAVKGIMKLTLEDRAVTRLGLATRPVTEQVVTLHGRTASRKVVPYGAIMYDTKGETWTYTNPEPRVYVRERVVVEDIQGDQVFLAEGPETGTTIVHVGAPELMGAEHKYGGH